MREASKKHRQNDKNKVKVREYIREYRAKNKDKVSEYNRRYHTKVREELIAFREWKAKNINKEQGNE